MTTSAASRSQILKRLESQATIIGDHSQFEECAYASVGPDGKGLVKQPRWRVDAKWVEFECGCRAERCRDLKGVKSWDPVIFEGLPEQSLYDFVCHRHEPHMNKRLMGNYVDFSQWRRNRRPLLIGH